MLAMAPRVPSVLVPAGLVPSGFAHELLVAWTAASIALGLGAGDKMPGIS